MVRMNNLRNREKKNGTKVWWRLAFVLSLQTHYEGGEGSLRENCGCRNAW